MSEEIPIPVPGKWEFSGQTEVYDDGLIRITLPSEFELVADDPEEMIFQIGPLPATIIWSSMLLDADACQTTGAPWGDVEGAVRFYLSDFGGQFANQPALLASGFWFASAGAIQDGSFRSRFVLGAKIDENLMIFGAMDFAGSAELADEAAAVFVQHYLKKSLRRAECSFGGPRMNSSLRWLFVQSLNTAFPQELGGLAYHCAVDHSTGVGEEDICLRYADDAGRRADVFIFTRGEELIEPGISSSLVEECFELSAEEARAYYGRRLVGDVRAGDRTYGHGEISFLVRDFLVECGNPVDGCQLSTLLLTAHMDRFLKVRFTSAPGEIQTENVVLEAFMEDLGQVLSR